MRATTMVLLAAAFAAPALAAEPVPAAGIPARPEQLVFKPFVFQVPKADKYVHKLKNGIVAYVAEDHTLPLVNVSVTVRAGAFLESPEKVGLASMTGTLMRKGGAGSRSAMEFDERADFLAANLSSFIGDTAAGASLSALSQNLGPSLDLLFDMVQAPRFEQGRLDIEKGNTLEEMKQRNDDAGDIASREWDWQMHGAQFFASRPFTKKNLDAIGREDLVAFHQRWFRPENAVTIAVSGDVDTKAILAELDKRFAAWKPAGNAEKVAWPPPGPNFTPKPGLYHVEKDIPQGKVFIGHLSTTWRDPDHYALQLMNHVLGGGGFTSRITKKVRSDEGLAYSAGSSFELGTYWPGEFRISFQTKSSTVPLAAQLSLAEMKRIREQPVSDDELAVARNSVVETFPRRFDSPAAIVGLFANDDYIGRPHAYWEQYQANIRKVSVGDVQRVAAKDLHPDQVVFLVVGKWADIEAADPGKRANINEFYGGKVTHLPLRDPLTLEPLP